MRILALFTLVLALSACATEAAREQTDLAAGQAIAYTQCSSCHAIGASGESPSPEAPAFRTLSRNYRVANLEEALAEGISVGHPAMPAFEFAPERVDALIAYLQSIQEAP